MELTGYAGLEEAAAEEEASEQLLYLAARKLKEQGIGTKPPSGELVDSLKEQVVIERINRQIFD